MALTALLFYAEFIQINGESSKALTLDNRGLQYGDGLFETIAFPNDSFQLETHPFWSYHLARLQKGCGVLGLKFDQKELTDTIKLHRSQFGSAIVKVILTRNQTGRGYKPSTDDTQIYARSLPWQATPQSSCQVKRWHHVIASQPLLAGIKHLNRLENVLASQEIDGPIEEIILCDSQGHAIEGTKSNLFALMEEGWVTPLLNDCGVEGVVRAWLLDHLPLHGIAVQESTLPYDRLKKARALFLCNTVIGVKSINQIDEHSLNIKEVQPIKDILLKVWPC